MKFDLTEEQTLIQRTARDFATRVLLPRAAARDEKEIFPVEELGELARLGLLGVNVPAEYGGSEAGVVAYALAMMEISRADASVAVAMAVTNMAAEIICRFGTEAQKKEHVPNLVGGPYLVGSFALSEPQAGSDAQGLEATATRSETGWLLRGTKQWITSGDRAGILIVWAKTEGQKKLSAFLVRGKTPGVSFGKPEDKMGLRGSSTVQVQLDDVAVGHDALLGNLGDGMKIAMTALDGGRIGIGAQSCGIAMAALEASLRYSGERVQFGVPLNQHQAIQMMLADMKTQLDAARLLVLRAAWRKENGQNFTREASIAKLYASERAGRICDQAVQIHGGYGYTREMMVERYVRDARVTRIYEGTSEVQRMVIAREELRGNHG